jgi:hypothetical protein
MAAKFLYVGLATDGPSNVMYTPKSIRELKNLFGGNFRERFYVSPTTSGLVMLHQPFSLPLNEVDGLKQQLFSPYLKYDDRTVMYFGSIGGSATHTVDLIYTPYLDNSDLLVAATRHHELTGELPDVIRIGGNTASLSVQGWTFEAKYAGVRYNYLGVHVSGSIFTLFGMEPNYPRKSYLFSSVEELYKTIERDFELGIVPAVCTIAGTAMISSGTYWFTGGTNGSFSPSDVENLFTNYDFPLKTSHVMMLTPITSSMITNIANNLQQGQQPRMFFVPAITYFGSGSAQEYIDSVNISVPQRHNMVASFLGEITLNYGGERITRYAAEGAAIAFSRSGGYNITNLPVLAETFTPMLSETNLELVKANGFIPLMRYIRNDIAVYEGTTTYAENSFLYSSKLAEISAIAYEHCFQYFGRVLQNGPKPDIASALYSRLAGVQYVTMRNITVEVQGEEMFVNIESILPEEILTISFTIQNH